MSFIKTFCFLLLFIMVLGFSFTPSLERSQSLAASYVEDIVDLPLMEGLKIIEGAGFVFEQENGRIVEKLAVGTPDINTIRFFYNDTLPQLGWTKSGDARYKRDKEELQLSFKKEDGFSVVIFHLSPLDPS